MNREPENMSPLERQSAVPPQGQGQEHLTKGQSERELGNGCGTGPGTVSLAAWRRRRHRFCVVLVLSFTEQVDEPQHRVQVARSLFRTVANAFAVSLSLTRQ